MSTTPVKGYTEQPKWKTDLVNSNKETEERILRDLFRLMSQSPSDVDHRWLALAKTHIEEGFMAYNRAIFMPQRLELPEDRNPFEGIA